jgi:hypothetical protein
MWILWIRIRNTAYNFIRCYQICAEVLRLRDVYPGSDFFPFRIPDPTFSHPGSRIRIKYFKYFNPKKWFLSSRKYDPGCSSRIRIPTFYPSRIPDPGVKKAPDPGSGSKTLMCREELVMLDQNYYPGQQRGVRQLLEQAAFQAALLNRNWHRKNCNFLTSGTGTVTLKSRNRNSN